MKKPQVLIVNGLPRSGKDTFAKILNKYAKVEKISIIDLAKHIALQSGWDGHKSDRSRQFLYELKKLIDDFSDASHIFIDKAVNTILKNIECDYILIDAREGKDITRLVEKFDAVTIKITNSRITHVPFNAADIAAKGCDIEYDIVLTNDGTVEDFTKTIEILHGQLINK